ncbi:MAG: HAD family hydrolase [Promethearchaeota archaeon]
MIYDYYLFDMDNCLIHYPDFMEFFDTVLVNTLESYVIGLPDKQERNKIWNTGIAYNRLLKKWGISNFIEFWEKFNENDFKGRKELINKGEIYLYKDVIDVLTLIKKAKRKSAIISNSPRYIVDDFVNRFEIAPFFDEILGIDYEYESHKAKPSPLGIISVLKKLNYNSSKSKAIMIGDSIIDIIAAKKANIYACLIKRNLNKNKDRFEDWEYKPDFITSNLYNIFKF